MCHVAVCDRQHTEAWPLHVPVERGALLVSGAASVVSQNGIPNGG